MARPRKLVILTAAVAAAAAVMRHGRAARGHRVPGGTLIGDAVVYDALSGLFLGSLVERIAADVAALAPTGHGYSRSGADPATCRSGWPATTGST